MPTPSDDLADLIGQLVDPGKILAEHVEVRGHCTACALPSGATSEWPCRLYRLAAQAQGRPQ